MTFARDDTFVLGLTMAGAVSAGAYTAGVLDFLIEALDTWQKAKEADVAAGRRTVPHHAVVLSAISGTSAGGVCAPLMCGAIAAGDGPVSRTPKGLVDRATGQPLVIRNYLPRLYDAWVVKPTLAAQGNGRSFLNLNDLNGAGAVQSLLNSRLLEEIGKEALTLPAGGVAVKYPFIAEKLHVFAMVGNAHGVPYKINFTGGAHGMRLHGDRIHMVVEGIGASPLNSVWAGQEEPHIKADANTLRSGKLDSSWSAVLRVAMATCAFPAALMARILKFPYQRWDKRLWPSASAYDKDGTPQTGAYPRVVPDWPANGGRQPGAEYEFLNVDGGIANNEAFEFAHYAIMENPTQPNPTEGDEADRMVLMIDPFPEPPRALAPKDSLLDSLKVMVDVMVNQARFKMDELLKASDENRFSRFLISPCGPAATSAPISGSGAMACGCLGGFGGFIEESFRAHDFQLGRRNCQKFLADHLAVPVASGPGNVPNRIIERTWSPAEIAAPTWYKNSDNPAGQYCQVIPLVGELKARIEPRAAWPKSSQARLQQIEGQIEDRLAKLGPMILNELEVRGFASWGLNLLLKLGKGKIASKIAGKMRDSLTKSGQL